MLREDTYSDIREKGRKSAGEERERSEDQRSRNKYGLSWLLTQYERNQICWSQRYYT